MLDKLNNSLVEEMLLHQIAHYLAPGNEEKMFIFCYFSYIYIYTFCIHIDFSNGCQILKQNPDFFDGRCITINNKELIVLIK